MAALEVDPSALVSAAAAVRCFALELEPVAVGGGPLLDVVAGAFTARWGRAVRVLSSDADGCARSLRDAAAGYVRLDRSLVPR